jgi:hypothetical protein
MDSAKAKDVGDSEKDSDPGLQAAVDDMFAAIESKDKSAFKEALKSFILMCDDDSTDGASEDFKSSDGE